MIKGNARLDGPVWFLILERTMTLPDERLQALRSTRDFLRELINPKATPRVPLDIRRWASRCLKHYPMEIELEDLASHRLLGGKDE
jgi:hypothetical protein